MAVLAVSYPLDDNKYPPKDDSNTSFPLSKPDSIDHKQHKRSDAAAFSVEEDQDKKNGDNGNHHLEKRDTTSTSQTPPTSDQIDRKVRDVSGQKDQPDSSKTDQHRIARDTPKKDDDKPKREVTDTNSNDPKTQQLPPKTIHKRDTTKEGQTHEPNQNAGKIDNNQTRHIRSSQEQSTPEQTKAKQ